MHNKVVDIAADDIKAGARVIMYDRKPAIAANQLWYEDEKGIIRSKLNGFVLDATSGRFGDIVCCLYSSIIVCK